MKNKEKNQAHEELKVKKENGDIFVWESNDNGWPGNVKANENDPVAWQVGAWTLDLMMCFANTSCRSFLAPSTEAVGVGYEIHSLCLGELVKDT